MKNFQLWIFVVLCAVGVSMAGCNSEGSNTTPKEDIAKINKGLPPSDPNPPAPPVREDGGGGLGGGKKGP
jgi:hypothetical protein